MMINYNKRTCSSWILNFDWRRNVPLCENHFAQTLIGMGKHFSITFETKNIWPVRHERLVYRNLFPVYHYCTELNVRSCSKRTTFYYAMDEPFKFHHEINDRRERIGHDYVRGFFINPCLLNVLENHKCSRIADEAIPVMHILSFL